MTESLSTNLSAGLGEPWRNAAACSGVDPSTFYPAARRQPTDAVAVCEHCTVRPECLTAAASAGFTWTLGVWAGTTPIDRRGLDRDAAYAGEYGDPLTDPEARALIDDYRARRRLQAAR